MVLAVTGCLALFRAQAATLSRQDIDALLQKLGDGDTASVKSGIDWGVMPGPFYTPLLGARDRRGGGGPVSPRRG
ncbi:Uncharacterised protein [Atlantibacter hermannii]|nr:Uncharacterised protein [Atlantibacter hermannii]